MRQFLIFASAILLTVSAASTIAEETRKSVLVTGASTGIGRHLAESLAADGFHVYAGARKQKDLDALNAIENITAVRLDVTIQSEVDAAARMIQQAGTGLYALVNNAGVGGGGPVTTTAIEEQRFVYDVNVEGVYRVTQAFAPMVIESGGRIAITGSIAGTLSWPGGTAYAGSKHWMEAYADGLAGELAPAGVSVSIIEPGNYQSFIRRNAVRRRFAAVEAAGGEITPEMKTMYAQTEARELSYKLPDDVTAAFTHALTADKPLRRYMVVPNADEQAMTITTKIQQLVQLNQWGPYSYDREALIEMLDAALADESLEAAPDE